MECVLIVPRHYYLFILCLLFTSDRLSVKAVFGRTVTEFVKAVIHLEVPNCSVCLMRMGALDKGH